MQVVDEGPQEEIDLHDEGGRLGHKEGGQATPDEDDRGSTPTQVVGDLRIGRQAGQNRELIEVVAREDCGTIEEEEDKRG